MTAPTDCDPPATTATIRAERWLETALLLALLLGSGVAMSRNTADADLWGHILFGLETVAAGRPLPTASHTYTAVGFPWINHENLSEIALAVIHNYGGGAGLLAVKCLLGLGLVGSMIFVARRRQVGPAAICLIVLAVAFNLSPGWTLRPQLFTYAALAAMVLILDAAFERWATEGRIRVGVLWLVVPLMLVWTNAHGGFVAGGSLLGLYLAVRGVEALRRAGWPIVLRLAVVGICAAAATLATPYGPRLHAWLYADLSVPRPEIAEWAPLTLNSEVLGPAVLMFVLCGASLLGTTRRRDPAQVLLILAAAGQSLAHERHLPLMAVLVGYWIPPHLDSVLARFRAAAGTPARAVGSKRSALALLLLISLCCAALCGILVKRSSQLWVDRSDYPVAAVDYMARHRLTGRLVATFNWAEYALAALPETSTSFDGRCRTCYPQSVHDIHFDFVLGSDPRLRWRGPKSPPPSGSLVLNFGRPDLVLLDRRQSPSVAAMTQQQGQWVLLYQDEIAQVWGRRTRFGDPRSVDYLAPADRYLSDAPRRGLVAWPAIPWTVESGSRTTGHFPPLKFPSRRGDT